MQRLIITCHNDTFKNPQRSHSKQNPHTYERHNESESCTKEIECRKTVLFEFDVVIERVNSFTRTPYPFVPHAKFRSEYVLGFYLKILDSRLPSTRSGQVAEMTTK